MPMAAPVRRFMCTLPWAAVAGASGLIVFARVHWFSCHRTDLHYLSQPVMCYDWWGNQLRDLHLHDELPLPTKGRHLMFHNSTKRVRGEAFSMYDVMHSTLAQGVPLYVRGSLKPDNWDKDLVVNEEFTFVPHGAWERVRTRRCTFAGLVIAFVLCHGFALKYPTTGDDVLLCNALFCCRCCWTDRSDDRCTARPPLRGPTEKWPR